MNPYKSPEFVDSGRHDYWLAKRIAYSLAAICAVYLMVSMLFAFNMGRVTPDATTIEVIKAFFFDWRAV